jgi:uncharacterized protein with GYD domain
MPGYVALLKFTPEGLAQVKGLPERAKQVEAVAEKFGVKKVGIWLTMGEYDVTAIWDAPDDQTMAAFMLAWVGRGTSTSQTMRAFSEEELAQIVGKLP